MIIVLKFAYKTSTFAIYYRFLAKLIETLYRAFYCNFISLILQTLFSNFGESCSAGTNPGIDLIYGYILVKYYINSASYAQGKIRYVMDYLD